VRINPQSAKIYQKRRAKKQCKKQSKKQSKKTEQKNTAKKQSSKTEQTRTQKKEAKIMVALHPATQPLLTVLRKEGKKKKNMRF